MANDNCLWNKIPVNYEIYPFRVRYVEFVLQRMEENAKSFATILAFLIT